MVCHFCIRKSILAKIMFSLTYSEQDFGVMFSEINFQRDEGKPFRGGSGQAAAYFGTVKQEFAWTLRFMI